MSAEPSSSAIVFEEKQHFRQWWLWALLLGLAGVMTAVFVAVWLGTREVSGALIVPAIMVVLVGIGLPLLFYFIEMSVRLDPHTLRIRYFPIWRRTIPVEEITSWEVRTYHPILEYGGWGIRLSMQGRGWCYNVSGNRGVQLTLRDGQGVLIGSQRPEELAAALQRVKGG
jgi:hypothetical protein